ncbi:sugar transferase [Rodentibacter pneumotropicus]|uniref:sugar transferase n=1 Tax=Rodentibacter pneumotropicus TaxID=758 RepID=UPI000984338E|nr:sugar transferase [Rodentibacter pneumotropicus]OOF59113.1 sugar transferase [Rodentibacter pneumotropicus]THA16127.1 sugar transferase [Rodentibacter pneumotropicus]
MSFYRDYAKGVLDVTAGIILLILFFPIIFISWLIASIDTKSNGFFLQSRIGKHGRPFKIFKIKTMYNPKGERSSITADITSDISYSGVVFRKYKLDEIPQLINIALGQMSFVGPRPDVAGYADALKGDDRKVLLLRPGITGPASIKYRNEEEILQNIEDKKNYNDYVIWPDKVKINKKYYEECSLLKDIYYVYKTIFK